MTLAESHMDIIYHRAYCNSFLLIGYNVNTNLFSSDMVYHKVFSMDT